MNRWFAAALTALMILPSLVCAEEIGFGVATIGQLPPSFQSALTGKGGPATWMVVDDPTAAGGKALAQTSQEDHDYRFPLAIYAPLNVKDMEASVRFKVLSGKEDRAAGIAFRLQDPDNYYVVRANALEDNVRLYHVVKGDRSQIAGADVKVPSGVWQTMAVRVRGDHIEVEFNGIKIIDKTDATFFQAGRLALWTKADSVTYFDRLEVKTMP